MSKVVNQSWFRDPMTGELTLGLVVIRTLCRVPPGRDSLNPKPAGEVGPAGPF
ncbi:hypothetical protein [Pelomonas sp. Root1444]|uniref:hypothetical protein n=1 Tax=Pelomonas sp. Root1444 TaxID=1736464 RepID=UPI0012F9CF8E|nr:hypothetical protein [Pelomonas sp. Root1444]